MAISDSQKVDYLWKKLIFGVSNTNIGGKAAANETIASPIVVDARFVWSEASVIPTTAPLITTSQIELRTGADAVTLVPDPTVPGNKAWLALVDPNGSTTDPANRVRNWIPPSFGSDYLLKVYSDNTVDPANSLNPLNNGFEWVFDYVSGVLQFVNNVPNVGTGLTVEGYVYVGQVGGTGGSGGGGTGGSFSLFGDPDPTLSAPLKTNGQAITGEGGIIFDTGAGPSTIRADGSDDLMLEGGDQGRVGISGYLFPDAVGSAGDILVVDSDGSLKFDKIRNGNLPVGTSPGQIFTWDGSTWVISDAPQGTIPQGTSNGQILVWNSATGGWVAQANTTGQTYWNLVQNKPTDIPVTGQNIDSGTLNLANGTLVVNVSDSSANPEWSAIQNRPTSFTPSAHTHTFGQITGFPQGSTSGDLLTWNGTQWLAQAPQTAATSLTGLSDTDVSGATSGQVLRYNGTEWVAATISANGLTAVSDDTNPVLGGDLTTGSFTIDGFNLPTADGSAGQVMVTDGNGQLGFEQFYNLFDLSPSQGQSIRYGVLTWEVYTPFDGNYSNLSNVPSTFAPSAHTHSFSDISDFPTGSEGDVLTYQSGQWVAATPTGGSATYSYNDLTDVPTEFPPSTHTHAWSEITALPTLSQSGGNVTGSIDLGAGTFALTAPAGSGGSGSGGYEWAVFQYQAGDTFDQAATQHSAGVAIEYITADEQNLTGFTFSGYNLPPVACMIYAQNLFTGKWNIIDTTEIVDQQLFMTDPNGKSYTDPDLPKTTQENVGQWQMAMSRANTGANNLNGLPTYYARVFVLFHIPG
tara:strand:+ start:112586 stop:114997 length:2412 start_codon:yes stop_codon:yes gene_type:complete